MSAVMQDDGHLGGRERTRVFIRKQLSIYQYPQKQGVSETDLLAKTNKLRIDRRSPLPRNRIALLAVQCQRRGVKAAERSEVF